MATAAIGAPTAPHGPALQLLTRLHHLNRLARSLPRRVAMDLLDDAARDCVKRSMTSRPCWRPRGRREHLLRLMQPAGAAATTASRPTAWLASPLAERHQRGAVSNVERSTHEAAGRGWSRGRGLAILLRETAIESAGARQAGRRDRHGAQRPNADRQCLFARLAGLPPGHL